MPRSYRIIQSLLVLVGLAPLARAADEAMKPDDYVAVVGDSITEQKMYSVLIEDYLIMCRPQALIHVTQFGWGGETAGGFAGRMPNDMLRFNASVATTCFGMNDGGYSPMDEGKAKRYHDTQKSVVDQMKKANIRFIVLGSSGCVDNNTFRGHSREAAEMYNKTLGAFRDIDRDLAKQEGVAFADVFTPMHDVMEKAEAKYGASYHVAGGDGVHPDWNGHLVMAYAFLKGLGCDGNVGTITFDLAGDKASATDGHKVLSATNGTIEIESTRYPFCFPANGAISAPSNERGVLEFFPFNQDLNRFKLVVTNAAGKSLKVTWGKETKTFSAEELGKGVNLAAEFLDNPFLEPFQKVQGVVQAQQNFETPLVKEMIHNMPRYMEFAPEEKEALERVINKGISKDKTFIGASLAAVQPVKHTIKVEVEK